MTGVAGCVLALTLVLLASSTPAATLSTLPAGFEDQVVFTGLVNPTNIRFSPDGRIFVAEKSGLIKVYDSLSDPTPDVFADLRTNVYNFWDRGLLGLALAPGFPGNPYVYVLYTYDHVLGDPAPPPKWGTPGATSDPCPSPPGATTDGCVVSGRLSRLQASGNTMVGSEQVLIEDWCQQYPSHSIGTIEFGGDGALYVGGGDGASFNFTDWGQDGSPVNPCGDPPAGVGGAETPPTAEGGALRSQDVRTTGDPVSLDGSILRVDGTGAPLPDNPLISNTDPNAKRIIAYGLRNPFRFTSRPGTNEIWIGDVGAGTWEEIDRIPNPSDSVVENFGWPCYEGPSHNSGFDSANLDLCESLYAQPTADTKPYFSYQHGSVVVPGETCTTGSSSVSGLTFAFSSGSSPYPAAYDNALFFADYSRNCIWVMKKGGNGLPAPGLIETFVTDAAAPVDLERAPNGEIYYADFTGGTIHRIKFNGTGGSGPYSDTVLADNPQLYWRLGQTAGNFTDASGHGNDAVGGGTGILRGQPDLLSANSDGSVKFTDPTSNITVGSPGGLSATSVSAEVWFKTGAHANWIDLLGHNWGGAGGQGWSLFSDATGTLYFGLWEGGGPQQLVSAAGLQLNTLYHAVGTYDGNVLRLYLNGSLIASKTVGALTLNTTASVFTGRVDTAAGVSVDEAAVYPAALSATRVQAHYNAGFSSGGNQPPNAVASAVPTSGQAPLTVNFSGTGSTDPEGGPLTYAWDLDGDGQYDDSTSATPSFTYATPANVTVGLKVTDNASATDTDSVLITVTSGSGGGGYPGAVTADNPQLYWRLGQTSGSFTDASGHGNDGVAGGTGLLRGQPDLVTANTDGSLKFTDATTNVTVASPVGLPSAAVSAEVWFKTGAHANWIDLLSHNWGGAGGQGWSLFSDATGGLYFGIWQGGGPQQLVSAPGLQLNTTYHAVGTYDGNVMRLYLNGALAASKTVGALTLNTTASVFSGRVDTAAGVSVDEAAVYPAALSASRVQAHFNAAAGGGGTNSPPTATISSPAASLTWKVGDQISFSGQATDPEDGALPASALHWDILLQHCPSNCHTHVLQTFDGVASGSFAAPDHEYPSHIDIKLTATDSQSATGTTSVSIQPKTVTVTLASQPTGLQLSLNSSTAAAPFTRTVIQGSTNTISAPDQTLNGTSYTFDSWSDAGAASHNVVVNANTTFTATFQAGSTPAYVSAVLADNPLLYWRLGEQSGDFLDASGHNNAGTPGGTGLSRHATDLVTGTGDGALTFTDATSNVTCVSPSGLPSSAVTVEIWFKTAAFANYIDLASHNWGGSGGSGWAMYTTSSRQLYWGLKEGAAAETSVKTTALNTNTVYHVVGTYDGNVLRLYLNGAQVASKTVGAKTLNTTASVFTGKTDTTSAVTADELALYSGALSAARVQAHYAVGH